MGRVRASGGGPGFEGGDVIPNARQSIEIQADDEPTEVDSFQDHGPGCHTEHTILVAHLTELAIDRYELFVKQAQRWILRNSLEPDACAQVMQSTNQLLKFCGKRLATISSCRVPAALLGKHDAASKEFGALPCLVR